MPHKTFITLEAQGSELYASVEGSDSWRLMIYSYRRIEIINLDSFSFISGLCSETME